MIIPYTRARRSSNSKGSSMYESERECVEQRLRINILLGFFSQYLFELVPGMRLTLGIDISNFKFPETIQMKNVRLCFGDGTLDSDT